MGLITSLLIVYLSLYFFYRMTHIETWTVDEEEYVVFGSRASYLFFRPATYLDGALTGVRFHLGPHREHEHSR